VTLTKLYIPGLFLAFVIAGGGLLWLNTTAKSPVGAEPQELQSAEAVLSNAENSDTHVPVQRTSVAEPPVVASTGEYKATPERSDNEVTLAGIADVDPITEEAKDGLKDINVQARVWPSVDSASERTVARADRVEEKIQRVYSRELVVSLVNANDAIVGAVELALNWDGELMYPRNTAAVCVDSSVSMLFQQGRVTPGNVRFGLIFPSISGSETELLVCQFNLVTDNADQAVPVSVEGSVVYALDTSVIGSGADVIKVEFR